MLHRVLCCAACGSCRSRLPLTRATLTARHSLPATHYARCGTPEVDISLLRQHTRYGVSVNPNDPHIAILWEVRSLVITSTVGHATSHIDIILWRLGAHGRD